MPESLNIVLYSNTCLPIVGGRELVLHHLARCFQELGHRVRIVGPAGLWSERKVRLGYPVHRYPRFKGVSRDRQAFLKLLFDLSFWGCDILHAHNTSTTAYTASRVKKIRDFPLVVTPHDDDTRMIPALNWGVRLEARARHKVEKALRSAEIVTAISASVADSLVEAGVETDKIFRVPNGVDLARFSRHVDVNAHERLDIPQNARIILTVGNYHPRKGHEILVSSMPLILAREPDARLVIVGNRTEALRPLIRELGVDDQVVLAGPIDFPTSQIAQTRGAELDWLVAIHRISDVYVSAAIAEGAEGLSLAVLEALASGLPVVATDISGNRDVISEGINGYLIPPRAPEQLALRVLQILLDTEHQTRMRIGARESAVRYDWNEIARSYLDVYAEALHRNKKS